MTSAVAAVERLVRQESGRVLATLLRVVGDFDLAEEAVQDALVTALTRWPETGVPDNPRAWLITTARNLAIDRIRRRKRFDDRARTLTDLAQLRAPSSPEEALQQWPDDRLKLLFTCCHPALPLPARVALTLRAVAGLTTPEIARAFLVERTTMQQRIVRAKKAIQKGEIPYEEPAVGDHAERLSGVLAVVYLVFTEGYGPTSGDRGVRVDLCEEALHLGRLLVELCPDDRETKGLLALMLLQHSRRTARTMGGRVVLLEDQDRSAWDVEMMDAGRALVTEALGPFAGPYALQAAIAAVHADAPTYEETDWEQIERLYRLLRVRQPGPVVALNHAVAAAMAHGPAAGLAMLEPLERALAKHHLFHCARGALWMRSGQPERSREAYTEALKHVGNSAERAFIEGRILQTTA